MAADLQEGTLQPDWGKGKGMGEDLLEKTAPPNCTFEEIPGALMQSKNYPSFGKSFSDYLYQTKTYDLFEAPDAKITSQQDEPEADFRKRAADILTEKSEGEKKKARERYAAKITALQGRLQRAQAKAETQKTQVFRQGWDAFISILSTIRVHFLEKKEFLKRLYFTSGHFSSQNGKSDKKS